MPVVQCPPKDILTVVESQHQMPVSQCGRCGYWLSTLPSTCPECGERNEQEGIILLGWANMPIQMRRMADRWVWWIIPFFLVWPWLWFVTDIGTGRTRHTILSCALASGLACILVLIHVLRRLIRETPQTVRIVLRREGFLQEPVARTPYAMSALEMLLVTGFIMVAQWGDAMVLPSALPFVLLSTAFVLGVSLLARYRPGARITVPWTQCQTIILEPTSPGRAKLVISRTKWEMRHPVDADLDLDEHQVQWLQSQINTMKEQCDVGLKPQAKVV